MQPNDKIDFLKVLNGIATIRKSPLTPEALDLWWACMADWSIEDFKAAAVLVLKRCKFMPMPNDFNDLRKASRDTAGEAWISARKYLVWGLRGYTLHADCPPLIARSVHAIGGANVIAMCDEDKLTFLERRFVEHFESIQDSEDIRESLPQLTYDSQTPRGLVSGSFKSIGRS